jgi:hypothetical protein
VWSCETVAKVVVVVGLKSGYFGDILDHNHGLHKKYFVLFCSWMELVELMLQGTGSVQWLKYGLEKGKKL